MIDEFGLIKSICNGDIDKFAVLIARYKKRVYILGMSFFKNTTDADDFMQDVFIKAYTSLSSFRGEAQFSTWLMRIAYNMAVNSIKRRKEYISISEETEILDTDIGPEEQNLRSNVCATVREAMRDLPEQYRICLDLYFFYDLSYNEISIITDLPLNTIKSHVFRAKKILRNKLEDIQEA